MDNINSGEFLENPLKAEPSDIGSLSIDEKIRIYSLHWIATGNKAEAYRKIGNKSENGAYGFHKQHQKKIEWYVWNNGFKDKVPLAINTLVDMMVNGRSDTAKLKAAVEVLDRAGFNKTDKLSVKDESTAKLEDQDINREITSLLENSNIVGIRSLSGGK